LDIEYFYKLKFNEMKKITLVTALIVFFSCFTFAKSENTKIFTVFLNQGYLETGGPVKNPLTNNDVLSQLQNQFNEIDFIARDITQPDISFDSLLNELEDLKENIDGVLIFGNLRQNKLAFTGLPTIVVYNLWAWDQSPYKLFATNGEAEESILVGGPDYKEKKGKVITAQIDRRQVCKPSTSKAMFDDLINKINLIQAIKKLKESRILSVSPHHYIAQVDYQGDINKRMPEDYNETFMRKVKEKFGVEIIRVEPEEFYEAYSEADEKAAEKEAEKWMREASGVKAAKSEIIKTARAYLAFDELREKYDCNAVSTHMRSVTGSGKQEDIFFPGLGLECGFKTRGIQAVCQDYPHILITQLLAYFITGKPSMLGDLMMDIENSVDILLHCGTPINPYGDERRVPYIIKTHAESPLRDTQKPGSGTGMQVMWPIGEPVTVWKVYPLLNKIGFHTGTTADGYALYDNYEDLVCRNKIIVKVENIKNIRNHYFADAYGIHRAATIGDLEETIKNLAVLLGLDVMDEGLPLK
jgi:hypothetical protein